MKIRNIFHIRYCYYKNFYGSHLKDRNRNYRKTETWSSVNEPDATNTVRT